MSIQQQDIYQTVCLPADRFVRLPVSTTGNVARPINMFMVGPFGVHHIAAKMGCWRVTHLMTGMYLFDCKSLLDAILAAGIMIGSGVDWDHLPCETEQRGDEVNNQLTQAFVLVRENVLIERPEQP